MTDQSEHKCEICGSSRYVNFCRDCAQKVCTNCLVVIEIPQYFCTECNNQQNGNVCGKCGSECLVARYNQSNACPSCSSTQIGEATHLIKGVPSEYYTIITKVEEVIPDIQDLYRSFDFMVGLVRFCREAGFHGFPQMEMELEKCANAMKKINERSIRELNQLRQEGLHELRLHNYFKDIKINHYRNIDAILNSTSEKIDKLLARVRHWIAEVQHRLEQLKPLAYFLRRHYELLADVITYLPNGIDNVAAIIPPMVMHIRYQKQKESGECYIIFSEEHFVFLPKQMLSNKKKKVRPIQVSYADFNGLKRKNSSIKGTQIEIDLNEGKAVISAPVSVLDRIEEYFAIIGSEEPYMVGSPKKIIEIETEAPDKNEYKRAAKRVINIFRQNLFGDPIQKPPSDKFKTPSMRELLERLHDLERKYREINIHASNNLIGLDEYQKKSYEIKKDFNRIRDRLNRLGGHFDDPVRENYHDPNNDDGYDDDFDDPMNPFL